MLWNGEEMEEAEPHNPLKREPVDDIAIAWKQINRHGDVEARRHKAVAMHGNSNASLGKVKLSIDWNNWSDQVYVQTIKSIALRF